MRDHRHKRETVKGNSMYINKGLHKRVVGTALLGAFIAISSGTNLALAEGVAITSTTATSQNLFVQWSAQDPERIDVIKWNPAGLNGSETNLTRSANFVGAPPPCHS